MRKKLFCLLFLLFITAAPRALEAQEMLSLQSANEAYLKGNYEEALKIYEAFLKENEHSAILHYNLGNTYFKLKKTGKAILHYEKAKKIKPRDHEINQNLNYAQGLIEYKLEDKRNWYLIHWMKLLDFITWEETLLTALLIYFSLMVFVISRLISKKEWKILGLTKPLLILFIISLAPVVSKYLEHHFARDAVVITAKAEVRYGPSDGDKVAFRLVDGLEVQVEAVRDEWYRVSLVNGETGWCHKKNLELV